MAAQVNYRSCRQSQASPHQEVGFLARRIVLLLPILLIVMLATGTALLRLPQTMPPGHHISVLDAMFTIASVVCLCGLMVQDPATQFTSYGQTVVGIYVQVGGFTIMILGSLVAVLGARRWAGRGESGMPSGILSDPWLRRTSVLMGMILVTTLVVELIGALLLLPMWRGDLSFVSRIGRSVFHSVSAFCNAGLTLQSDSLVSYRYALGVHLVLLVLVVIGGLGFPVIWELARFAIGHLRGVEVTQELLAAPCRRLSLHSKLVLTTTLILYIGGTLVLTAAQLKPSFDRALQQGQTPNQTDQQGINASRMGCMIADASFTSLSSRTAGFYTLPMDQIEPAGRFAVIMLMLVGASSGGSGGGMKTTTIALVVLAIVATIRQRHDVTAFGRRIHGTLIRVAGTLAACFLGLVCLSTLLLSVSEPYPLEKLIFESVSAASTTGLSLGITSGLTAFGKVVIIATMILGRFGPLLLLALMIWRGQPRAVSPNGSAQVLIG